VRSSPCQPSRPIVAGTVYLAGAGPGDPDLLTLRVADLIAQANTVVYDQLVSPAILARIPAKTECIYAGKERGQHILRQEEINALLITLARRGRCVLRLKGGDPYIFGRGGEEAQALADAGVAFEVVPGVTAAAGISAYSGIPLTHRDYAQSVVFVTAHLKDGSMDLDWHGLVRPRQTLVFYMGLFGLACLCEQLIAHGLPKDWPAAMVQMGTTPDQKKVCATLATLPNEVALASLLPPTLIIVGEVVRLAPQLAWFAPCAP
jgi:uroporphyrin-III C-methyltransferase/precorrin-2 dehydrogenase/sirohydrochlorin ferrochelatase